MTNKQNNYWKNRFEKIESSSNAYAQDIYRQIEPIFIKAQREIQNKIDIWYTRIARNNQVSILEAKKFLSTKEIEEFKWDVKDFIKYGEENALNSIWMKQLENASAKYHISRLEALKIQTQQSIEKVFGNELDYIDTMARKVYSDNYYRIAYEVQKGLNIGWDIAKIDERKLEKLILKPWATDGKNFSDRIWQSKISMVNELHNELIKNCILGKPPDEAIKSMTKFVDKKFKNAKVQAGRLVMTEQAFFASVAQKDCFNELNVEEFEIVATLDSHTSSICQEMDGKHFSMKDFEPGITAPPFHVWCRSTTVPFFDDSLSIGERVARDKEGKTYYIPDDMKYSDWKKKYIDDAIKDYDRELYNKYKNILGKNIMSIEKFIEIRYNKFNWNEFKAYANSIKLGELSIFTDFELYKNISKEIDDKLIGIVTSNSITITGKSKHFIARVIGSVEQRRNGVQISDILDALTNSESEIFPIKQMKNGRSQKFRNKFVEVSVNPDTGNIIQVNPVHSRKKR